MKRIYPLALVFSGVLIGVLCGTMLTTAHSDQVPYRYDQVVMKIGETTVTRGELAEKLIASYGETTLSNELLDRALVTEAARRNGVTVTADEVEQRMKETLDFAASAAAKKRLEAVPQDVLADNLRMILLVEKMTKLTVTEDEARVFYGKNPSIFTHPAMAKVTMIDTETLTKANTALNRLKGGEDPGELSSLFSTDKALRDRKGDLGWTLRSQMSPQVAEAIFDGNNGKGLGQGQFTDIIRVDTPDQEIPDKKTAEFIIFYINDVAHEYVPKFDEIRTAALYYCRANKYAQVAGTWFRDQAATIGHERKQLQNFTDPQAALVDMPINPNRY